MQTVSKLVHCASLACAVIGCSSDPAQPDSTPRREGPLYVVSNTVPTPDAPTSYVTVVDSLEQVADVDPAQFLEFPGSARAYGPAESDVVYVTSSEDATMTEVTFDDGGSAHRGRTVSFANLGVESTSGGNVNLFLSARKAYFVSQDSLEIIVWNPEAMEIIETVPLGLTIDDSFPYPYFYPRPLLVGDRLLLISNNSSDDFSGPNVNLTLVDTENDRVVSNTIDARCHSFLQSGVDANGDRYFASSDIAAAEHLLAPDAVPAPCMLRLRAGETSFDADWSRALDDELDTALWTGVTQGSGGKIYVQALDDDGDDVKQASAEGAYDITAVPAWTWYTLQDGDAAPARANTGLVTPPVFAPISVDGNDYVSVWDDVDTTLVNLTANNEPTPGLVVPGFVYNVVRIR